MASKKDFEFQRFKTEMGVSVIKQLVSLDIGKYILLLYSNFVDVEHQCINGCTDICLIPHSTKLHDIRLNCRQCEIISVTVNDVRLFFCSILSFLGSSSIFIL